MPDAEPGARAIAFPAVYDGVHVLAEARASSSQITITGIPGKDLEIPLETWRTIAPFLTAVALMQRPD